MCGTWAARGVPQELPELDDHGFTTGEEVEHVLDQVHLILSVNPTRSTESRRRAAR